MIVHPILSRVAGKPHSPTADLYVRNPLGAGDTVTGAPPAGQGLRDLVRMAPTVFESPRAVLVVRHDLKHRVRLRGRRLVYLLDDDVFAAAEDPSLPVNYRRRLRLVDLPQARRFLAEADHLVVSSEPLAEALDRQRRKPGQQIHIVSPQWSEPMPGTGHFRRGRPPRLAFLASRVHRADLDFVLPVIARVLGEVPDAVLSIAANHEDLGPLTGHPRVERFTETAWGAYREALPRMGCHLALYPLRETATNRARSSNKIIEQAIAGAAGIYSAWWPGARQVQDGVTGFLLPNDPLSWAELSIELLRNPARLRALSGAAQRHAATLNDPQPLRDLWQRLL